jgi:hypothetical protein
MLKKSQFYTVRRELLGAVGVDIAAPPPSAVDVLEPVTAGLDPAGWDPEPLAAHYVEPDELLAASYKLL